MLFCLFLAPVQAQATPLPMISGSADWNFYAATGEFSITGNGKVQDLSYPSLWVPWRSINGDIKSIHIDPTIQLTSTANWFEYCNNLTTTNASEWDVSQVTDMHYMFLACTKLVSLDTSHWDTSAVTDMRVMFDGCYLLTNLDTSHWHTSSVTNMNYVFSDCYAFPSLDVCEWDTSAVTDISGMFMTCHSLTDLDVSKWDTSAVANINGVFGLCQSLTSLDLSGWNTSAASQMQDMFYGCTSLKQIAFGPNWQFNGGAGANFPRANQDNDPAYLQKRRAVGTGTTTDPADTQYSETELMTYYATPRHTTETFVWAPRSTHYYVDFADGKPAGVTDAVHNLPTTIKVETTQDTTVPTQVSTLDGYTFEGYAWNGKTLKPGDVIEKQSAGTHITLTAVWTPVITYYYVDFADGKPSEATDSVQNLPAAIMSETTQDTTIPAQTPTLVGCVFKGYSWNSKTVNPGETINKQVADTHITLTAVWEKTSPKTSSTTTYTTPSLSIDLHSELPANQDLTVPYAGTDNHLFQTGGIAAQSSALSLQP